VPQCFDAVGWAAGRASGQKTEWWGAGVVIYLERGADLHMAQLMPLPLTVSCFSKIQICFTFSVPAYPGSPGQRAVKRVCVCVYLQDSVTSLRVVVDGGTLGWCDLEQDTQTDDVTPIYVDHCLEEMTPDAAGLYTLRPSHTCDCLASLSRNFIAQRHRSV